jgi:hypothetical protein
MHGATLKLLILKGVGRVSKLANSLEERNSSFVSL